jgi:hypothetical protein
MTYLFLFTLGVLATLIVQGIISQLEMYHTMKEKLEEFERKNNACSHGYEDWDDCPDCCH